MSAELTGDVRRQRQIKQRLAALGLEGRCAVFHDEHGHLRLELEGKDVDKLGEPEQLDALEQLLDCPLQAGGQRSGCPPFGQREPLMAVAGCGRPGPGRDAGERRFRGWFKDDAGRLYILLCDGMGSGWPPARTVTAPCGCWKSSSGRG